MSWSALLQTAITGTAHSEIAESVKEVLALEGAPDEGDAQARLLDAAIFFRYREKFASQASVYTEALPDSSPPPRQYERSALRLFYRLLQPELHPLLLQWLQAGKPFPEALLPELLDLCTKNNHSKLWQALKKQLQESTMALIRQNPQWHSLLKKEDKAPYNYHTIVPKLQELALDCISWHPDGYFDIKLPELSKQSSNEALLFLAGKKGKGSNKKEADFILFRLFAHIPPDWWVQTYERDAATLLEMHRKHPKQQEIFFGWMQATINFSDADWAPVLFLEMQSRYPENPIVLHRHRASAERARAYSPYILNIDHWKDQLFQNIVPLMTREDFEQVMEPWFSHWQEQIYPKNLFFRLLKNYPKTWSLTFSRRIIHVIQSLMSQKSPDSPYTELLTPASFCLPPEMIEELRNEWGGFKTHNWEYWESHIEQMMDTLLLRRQLIRLSNQMLPQND